MGDSLVVVVFAVIGLLIPLAWLVARRAREQKYVSLEQLGAELGFTPLGDRAMAPTVGGTRDGFAVLVQRVERRDAVLPQRVDVLLRSELELVPTGGFLLRPDEAPVIEGDAPKLTAALTPDVHAAAATLGGRLQARSLDGVMRGSAFDVLVRSRWAEGWKHMMLRTWLPLDATAEQVRAAVSGLVGARAALSRAPGVTNLKP